MTAAEPGWLDLRVSFDDAARKHALPLLDEAARSLATRALTVDTERPLVVIDVGAGTGNSMRWFDARLTERLRGRRVQWVLVDADEAALEVAADRFGTAVHTVAAPISSLPDIAAEALAAASSAGNAGSGADPRTASTVSPHPCELLITGSALLDVLTRDDTAAIIETLHRFSGIGIFLLSIAGQWHLSPPHPDDEVIDEAFGRHQRRDSRLGTQAAPVLEAEACDIGARVETSAAPWHLEAPRDSEFLIRFLTERVDAAIEEDPGLREAGRSWLKERLNHVESRSDGQSGRTEGQAAGLRVVVDHTDVLIDATDHRGRADRPAQPSGEPKR
ncbi:class I SAM-dependent methyltransferase [Brevibacterium aurantiacum]|uniref:Class I SAM-dependent methyltransferase n=1 Tax=Brevibacterium aurantiacum TaxID=273384 RepID=A0A2A3X5P9_BREAU|nr:class I SAM-dependent methyltransferase [Brevibacterium aurantiacum]AZL12584.1 class I SAM-dependent methyltransferase [Brevibacterium aurantiacum]AZT96843.1 class I SAM-dependent methyltransferase [Brevibacterium aurantiacum]PCC19504.1 class I SAM-dependent methyltransferase [Brevibacterium aurantiacum]PCC57920.1 class I SAM-dependent methyltransferase [Brevibacterium aurantiacum]RCS96717.1 class I SAM-dependent methyltransferase [Brevibacterium aurantiacum]